MFSRRPSGGADFILLFTPGNLFGNERRAGCGTTGDCWRGVDGLVRDGARHGDTFDGDSGNRYNWHEPLFRGAK